VCVCVYMPPSATAFFLVCIPLAASASFHSGRPLSNPARQLQLTAPCRTARPACELTDLPPRPDPSRLVSSLDVSTQRLAFAGISAGVVAGTAAFATLLSRLDAFVANAPAVLPIPLGLAFTVAGVTHFTLTDMYVRLTPPRGTWGCWQVPAPGADMLGISYGQYHTYWTGVAEVVAGASLVLSAVGLLAVPLQLPCAALFLLTAAVTPANIYQFTHDVSLEPELPVRLRYPQDHAARGLIQLVLLAVWWDLATLPLA